MGKHEDAFENDESRVGLLNGIDAHDGVAEEARQKKLVAIGNIFSYLLNVFFLLFFLFSTFNRDINVVHMVYSPANEVVEHSVKAFYDGQWNFSPYQGTPTDELDQMWDDLYDGTARTLIDETVASKLPNKTVKLETGKHAGKYMVQLEVFHQLHCLNGLRKSLYPDRFPDDSVTDADGKVIQAAVLHFEHCIDRIRQGIQCHADVATLHWNWKDASQLPSVVVPDGKLGINFIDMGSTHVCRNFEAIQVWARERNLNDGDWDNSIIY